MTGDNVIEAYYSVLFVLGVSIYLVATDENLAKVVWLKLMVVAINTKRYWMMMTMYPKLRYDRWALNRARKQVPGRNLDRLCC